MSVKCYGIFTAYPPSVDLRSEGLGRLLAAFLKATETRKDIRFIVACPSWSKQALFQLCESEGVDPSGFDLLAPTRQSLILSIARWLRPPITATNVRQADAKSKIEKTLTQFAKNILSMGQRHRESIEGRIASTRNPLTLLLLGLYVAFFGLVLVPFLLAVDMHRMLRTIRGMQYWRSLKTRLYNRLLAYRFFALPLRAIQRLRQQVGHTKIKLRQRLYQMMEDQETRLIVQMANAEPHVRAWYSPAAFWPVFNQIKAPHLTCVPDLVITEFPIGFGGLQSARLPFVFAAMEETIRTSDHFVTYSEQVKWTILVDRYGVDPAAIDVVRHAACDLSPEIAVTNLADAKEVKKNYCRRLLREAIVKSGNGYYTSNYIDSSFRFLFYASQFRPSKNVLTLLRAYEYLLRKRFISYKLVLSGHLHAQTDIFVFVHEHNLTMDVLFLHGMTLPELTACYHLADLVINPSLSEGGCPFTLTEALSVGTPVVMSRIPVTEEIITEPDLQELMLFDGYDWKDMAHKIEWALQNRKSLLARQKQLYERLATRTWSDVVGEYVAILDRISTPAAETATIDTPKFLPLQKAS